MQITSVVQRVQFFVITRDFLLGLHQDGIPTALTH
jgi:hypothetical protein